jgi:periplasmic protein TonB
VPNDGEAGAPAVVLPADLAAAERGTTAERRRIEDWLAIAAAAVLHALVIFLLLWNWRFALPAPAPEAVPVQLVMEPPPAPTPAPPPPPAPQPPQKYRESGKDEQTTAAPSGESPGPQTSTPPPPPPPSTTASPEPAPPEEKPKPRKEAMRTPERKEAEVARAPRPNPQHLIMLEPADRDQSGDRYLNLLVRLIERHRVFPKAVGQFGLPLEGVARYSMTIDRSGQLVQLAVARSSGAPILDEAGEGMIRQAAPFPPVPADYPGSEIRVTVVVPLYSNN